MKSDRSAGARRAALAALCCVLLLPPMSQGAAVKKRPAPGSVGVVEPQAARPEFVRELGGIEEYRLANGLQILLLPDPSQSTTTVNLTYRVGSRHEAPGEYGMAHLLEHLLFKGTPSQRDIAGEFARRGMRWNGTTTADRTNYFASFNASEETLNFALALEADRMVNSLIARSDLDREMTVVRNEFERSEDNPVQVLTQHVKAAAYAWHPYGKSTIGPRSDIENLPIEKLLAFYRRWYRPDNATLLLAGNFDKAAALAQIGRHFGSLARPTEPMARPYTVEPAQDGERVVMVRRVGGQQMLMVHYHVPAVAHPDTAALIVYANLLSMPSTGVFHKRLVQGGLAAQAGMMPGSSAEPGGALVVAAMRLGDERSEGEKRLLDVVEGREALACDEADLAHAKEMALGGFRQQMNHPDALIHQLSNLIAAGDWRLLFQIAADIPKVSLADVERVRAAYFRPSNRTVGRYLPAREVDRVAVPAAPPLDERLAQLQGPARVMAGEAFDPTPENLASRTVSHVLPSGITLETLRKQTRGDTVQLRLRLRWGEREATFAWPGTAMVGQLMREGSISLDRAQLQSALLSLKATLHVSSFDQGATLTLDAERDTLLPALRIAADVLQHPRLPPEALLRARAEGMAMLQAARSDPLTLLREATRAHRNDAHGAEPGQPDYRRSIDDRIHVLQVLGIDDVRAFHAEYWSANEASVAVVGALPDGLEQEIEALLGSWKKPQAPRFERHVAHHVSEPPARFDVPVKDRASAFVRMSQPLALGQADGAYQALLVAVHVLGGGALESRLAERLRQREGLSYQVHAALSVPAFGDAAEFVVDASCAPENRERVVRALREEMARMSEQGISAAELSRAKQDLLAQRKQARGRDDALAEVLLAMAERGQRWSDIQGLDADLLGLSVDQVNAAWRQRVGPEGFVVVTLGSP